MGCNQGDANNQYWLIPKYIGSDFDHVIVVSTNIEDVKACAANVVNINIVANNIDNINTLAGTVGSPEELTEFIKQVMRDEGVIS